MRHVIWVAVVAVLLPCAAVSAYFTHIWTYEELFEKADLVVMARPRDTVPAADKDTLSGIEMQGQNTRFDVLNTLKGKAADGPITLLHFHVKPPTTRPGNPPAGFVLSNNGPQTLTFVLPSKGGLPPAANEAVPTLPILNAYLLFLTRTPDGRYEPLSGRFDPTDSVMEIHPAKSDGLKMYERTKRP